MGLFVGYQGAARCTDGPTAGARAFMAWFVGAYAGRGGKNLGIYNCRTVRGGTTTSLHGEGRALDFGINPHRAGYGTALAEQIRLSSAELGVQCVIWNRRIWSGSYSRSGWRTYNGTNAHVDHLHVELSWHAARTLTAGRVQQILGGSAPAVLSGRPVLRRGDTGPAVGQAQDRLGLLVDADFGPVTEAAVRKLQQAHKLVVDGVVGPATWAALDKTGRDWFDMATEADLRKIVRDEVAVLARRADVGYSRDQVLSALGSPEHGEIVPALAGIGRGSGGGSGPAALTAADRTAIAAAVADLLADRLTP